METLMARQSPLFGRMTGQWHLEPLPFASLGEFFPAWDAEARIAAYAMVGGIPAYLNWLDRSQNLVANLRHVMVAPGSMFMAEPTLLLYDEVREPTHYLAVLKAIGAGKHTLQDISNFCFMPRTSVNTYLDTLQTLRLVERRLPATVRPAERLRVRSGRYHLSDPYFRFFFRFLAPFQDDPLMQVEHLISYIQQNLRAFAGRTAFEDLARQWVLAQARAEHLPFRPDAVGSHWSSRVQVDVVALNWETRELLLGECKWGDQQVDKQVVEDLVTHKTPLVLKDLWDGGAAWRPHYVIFGRKGITPAARTALENQGGLFVDVPLLDEVLGRG
jgi:AAA+ ATPase superfamily predicted ATPase